jgi:uncharacterized membrane protein
VRFLFLVGFFLLSTLFANETFDDTTEVSQSVHMPKVLYLSHTKTPSRILKGEIFAYTIKTLPTLQYFKDITYEQINGNGLNLLHSKPYRKKNDAYFYDTFYFLVTEHEAKIPDFVATIHTDDASVYPSATLKGEKLNIVTLNPRKDFANIIADTFELVEYKTTSYDDKHNIIVFVAKATNCAISALELNGVYKQGVESISKSYFESKITYFVIVPKELENLNFSYFNLKTNNYALLNIPIIVDDDSVATQTDLKPKDFSKDMAKVSIALVIALIAAMLALWRKKYIYLIFLVVPLSYAAIIVAPAKDVCIKSGSAIYLLPMKNGTIFEITDTQIELQKEGNVDEFTKVKLRNEKIGWVKNEDICSY